MQSLLLALVAASAVRAAPVPAATDSLEDKQNPWELSGLFEGDIVLPEGQGKDMRNAYVDEELHWPDATIPYRLRPGDFDDAEESFIEETLEQFNMLTCAHVRIAETYEKDYVLVTNEGPGCWAGLGRRGGEQKLNLGPGCVYNNGILHEFMHAFGFGHMQSAPERDQYITIVWDNIEDGREPNFEKANASAVSNYGVPYDYESVMHYSEYVFSKNGQRTIVPRDPYVRLGKGEGLSDKDILKLERMYNCTMDVCCARAALRGP